MRFYLPASSMRRLNPKVSELDADATINKMGGVSSQTYGMGTHINKCIPPSLTTCSDRLVDWLVVDALELIMGRVGLHSTDVGDLSVSENEIGHSHSERYGYVT
jgi:hypothetical protein